MKLDSKANKIPAAIWYTATRTKPIRFPLLLNGLKISVKVRSLYVKVLPKKLDEEVARDMVEGFSGVITQMTTEQAQYINVPIEGPYKPETYKY